MGVPAKAARLMVDPQYLNYTFNESDEPVASRWVENSCRQYFRGFTIAKGYALGDSNQDGAGMYTNNGDPTVRNCIFLQNQADHGGGMFNTGSSTETSNPTITDCIFRPTSSIVRAATAEREA